VATPELWLKIKEIAGAALERELGERSAFLDQACLQDPELRSEVESLLAARGDAGGLSHNPWADTVTDPVGKPQTIGPYRLIHVLGAGGMGEVWLAEQTEPVQRRVALKLIRAGNLDSTLVRRFQSERQSLAIMDHPAIAKVFDAGATPAGQPYFAMEYVDGLPITDYCDCKKLGIRDRLNLFMQVCDGVQHAHQKAIIHRDLKPSNILVAEVDGKPTPRIIDFGLAKAATAVPGETLFTQVGAFLGTPGYTSPEQADPNVPDIDTRTDVYSLGVVLYELLTGFLPFDTSKWKKQRLDEVLQELRETDPPRPSTKVSENQGTSPASAEARGIEPRQLATLLSGDLDWITLKALEKERERRYGTPSALAADVERYLQNRPVEARPESAAYRLRKYVRRNRVAVAVAAGATALLIAFAVMQTIELRRITRERDRADRITEFMTNMFKVSDPSEARGNIVTAREILDKSSKEIDTGLAKDPETQAQMMQVMASTYMNLGLYSRAHELFERALENRRRVLGPNAASTLESMNSLGWILDRERNDGEAEKITRQALESERRTRGPEDPLTLEAMDNLAIILENQGHYQEEEKLQRELIEIRSRQLGPENPRTLRTMANLANAIHNQGRNKEAEELYRRTLAMQQRVLGPDHPQTLASTHNLANLLQDQGHYTEAEALYRETLDAAERVMGPEHPDVANTMTTLANTLVLEGRTSEAEGLYRSALEILLRTLGAEHPYTTLAEEGLANVLSTQGKYAEAEQMHRRIFEVRVRTLGPEHTDTLLSKYNVADVLVREERFREAEKLLRETLAAQTKVLGPENPDTLASEANLSRVLNNEGRYHEAETTARQAFDVQRRTLGPRHEDTIVSLQYLATAMVYSHRYPEAKELFTSIIESSGETPELNNSVFWYDFACVAVVAGAHEDALHYLREAVAHGYSDAAHMRMDADLKPLHGDPRFVQLVNETQKRAEAEAGAKKTK
jgi:serine/threonine protein kinase